VDQVLEKPLHGGEEHDCQRDVAVAVLTPSGIYPDEDDFRRVAEDEVIKTILDAAAEKLRLTNTADWVARAGERELDNKRTFREECLSGVVEIHWHKREGGGGARGSCAAEF